MEAFSVSGGALAFGDSITADSISLWFVNGVQAFNAANPSKTLGYLNWAVSGQQQANSWTIANAQINQGTRFAVWSNWSQNDGVTAAIMQSDFDTYVQAFIDLAHSKGAIPILLTSIPSINITTAANDTGRKSINDQTRALAADDVLVADMDAVMSDGAALARIISGKSSDGYHPNAAGAAVMAPVLQAAIQGYIDAH